jgi:N-acetyl-anhydromuramyl-L-alanine amidase AmpD
MGLLDIGYHYIIGRNGQIKACRPEHVMGSHAPGLNHESIGVCLMGGEGEDGRPVDNFTLAQREALSVLLLLLRSRYHAKVTGHSEVQRLRTKQGAKRQCPMIDMNEVRSWL